MSLENPTVLTLPLDALNFGIGLDGTRLGDISLKGLSLRRQLNDLSLDLNVDFMSTRSQSSDDQVRNALKRGFSALLDASSNVSAPLTLDGPIKIPNADFLEILTRPLRLALPGSVLSQAIGIPTLLQSLVTPEGLAATLGGASLDAAVGGDGNIQAHVGLELPIRIPVPDTMDIGFGVAVAVGSVSDAENGGASSLGVRVDDIGIGRGRFSSNSSSDGLNSVKGIRVNVATLIKPVNNEGAAKGLADALNPALALQSQKSVVAISSVGIVPKSPNGSSTAAPFPWSDRLFASLIIPFPLPALPVASVLDAATGGGTSLPVSIRDTVISQLDSSPGFKVNGQMGVSFAEGITIPALKLDVGYLGVNLQVPTPSNNNANDGKSLLDLASVQFSEGLHLTTVDPSSYSPLSAALTLSKNEALTPALQSLVDGVTSYKTDSSSALLSQFIAVTGIKLADIITFNKIIVPIPASLIAKLGKGVVKGLGDAVASRGSGSLLRLDGLDLNVKDKVNVEVGIGALLRNPLDVSVALGFVDGVCLCINIPCLCLN